MPGCWQLARFALATATYLQQSLIGGSVHRHSTLPSSNFPATQTSSLNSDSPPCFRRTCFSKESSSSCSHKMRLSHSTYFILVWRKNDYCLRPLELKVLQTHSVPKVLKSFFFFKVLYPKIRSLQRPSGPSAMSAPNLDPISLPEVGAQLRPKVKPLILEILDDRVITRFCFVPTKKNIFKSIFN